MSNVKKHLNLPNILIFGLSALSFATTYMGLRSLSGMANFSLGSAFLFIVVLILQTALVASLLSMIRFHGLLRISFFILYFIFMNVSVYFSYNFYYDVIQSGNFENKVIDGSINKVLRSADNTSEALESLNIELESLSEYSRSTALIEKSRGRTCDPSVGSGEGPRRYLRDWEALLFSDVEKDFELLVTQLSKYQTELRVIESEYQANRESVDIKSLERNINRIAGAINSSVRTGESENLGQASSRLSLLLSRLKPASSENRTRMESYDTRIQQAVVVSCPDKKIGAAIDNILETSFKEVEELELFDGEDNREVLGRSVRVYSSLYGASNDAGDIYEFTSNDYFPLIAGFAVDIAILIVPLWAGLIRRHPLLTSNDVSKAKLFFTGKASIDESYVFLSSLMYKSKAGYFLIAPNITRTDIDDPKMRIAQDTASLLEFWEVRNYLYIYIRNVKGKKLPIKSIKTYQYEGAENDRFDVYKFKKSTWNEYLVKLYEELDSSAIHSSTTGPAAGDS